MDCWMVVILNNIPPLVPTISLLMDGDVLLVPNVVFITSVSVLPQN